VLLAWSAAIWWALTSTRLTDGPLFPGASFVFNVGHAVIFAVEALLIAWVLQPAARPGHGRWLMASLLAWSYSGALEWRQGSIEGRQSSVADMLTNAIGAFGVPWMLSDPEARTRRAVLVGVAALASAMLDTLS
jgi:VanZ family protein